MCGVPWTGRRATSGLGTVLWYVEQRDLETPPNARGNGKSSISNWGGVLEFLKIPAKPRGVISSRACRSGC
eukprot:4935206-Prymnesium_polylepis.1